MSRQIGYTLFTLTQLFLSSCTSAVSDQSASAPSQPRVSPEELERYVSSFLQQDEVVMLQRLDMNLVDSAYAKKRDYDVSYRVVTSYKGHGADIRIPVHDSFRLNEEDFWSQNLSEIRSYSGETLRDFIEDHQIDAQSFSEFRELLHREKIYSLSKPLDANYVEVKLSPSDGLIYIPGDASHGTVTGYKELKKLDQNWYYFAER